MLRPMSSRLRPLACLPFLLAACGDDAQPGAPDAGDTTPVCVDTSDVELEDATYAAPSSMPDPEVGCAPGGLAELDLSGRWHVAGAGPFDYGFPLVEESCEGGTAVSDFEIPLPPSEWTLYRDDELLFWTFAYQGDGFSVRWSRLACAAADGDGLAAVLVTCYGDDCVTRDARMNRFAHPEGEADADGLALVGELGADWEPSFTTNVRVADEVAYVARFGELRVVDVSDPAAPVDLARLGLPDDGAQWADYNDLKIVDAAGGRYLVLAGQSTWIAEVSDPTAPALVASLGEYAHSVFVDVVDERPLVYLANYEDHVPIFDFTDPTSPALLARAAIGPGVEIHDLYAEGTRLYVNGTTSGFHVVDVDLATGDTVVHGSVETPYSHASWVGTIGDRTVAIHGDEGRGALLRVYDVDPTSEAFLSELGRFQTREEVSIHNMILAGDRAYVAYYQDGVRVLDLSDPSAPTEIAHLHTWDPATGAAGPFEGAVGIDRDPDTGRLYVADSDRGLLIVDETSAPTE